MIKDFEDAGLEEARRNLQSLAEKSDRLSTAGVNLDRDGEPRRSASHSMAERKGVDRDLAAAARSSLRGPEVLSRSPNNGLPQSDLYITGMVGGRPPVRTNVNTWSDNPEDRRPKEAMVRASRLSVPVVRPLRVANDAGATSFHFSHESISKTHSEKTSARGTRNRKGAATAHADYIERDSAVARGKDGRAGVPDTGAMATAYIEREEALAHGVDGTAILFSNISDDAAERRAFWQLVEQAESNPSADRMQLRIAGHQEFWRKVAGDADCPAILRQSIEAAEPSEYVIVRTGNNELARTVMKRHGWKPRERRPANETDEHRAAREEREAANAFGARFEDGRGGRVQFRIVGELPHDVSHDARVRILKDFAAEFEARRLPYIAVMHAPDHTNDDRNWHFHLVYHDRPVKRFTGLPADHLKDLPEGAGSKWARRREIAEQALADPATAKHIGQWDFTVPWTYRKRTSGNIVEAKPFEQVKDRECNNRNFIPMLRRHLASLTNRELEKAGVARRVGTHPVRAAA